MIKWNFLYKGFIGICALVVINLGYAASPLWTFTPTTPTSITISPNGVAVIAYTITNQSKRPHLLGMKPIKGITASGCMSVLGHNQSCILTLEITGSSLSGNVYGGPEVCQVNSNKNPNSNQCYQPNSKDVLNITLAATQTFTVTPSGTNVTISPSTPQTVDSGATQSFQVTANTGYTLSNSVGGTCPAGVWSGATYTTGAITSSCSVSFSATINSYTVTPSGTNVTITPNTPQSVNYGSTQSFNVTANSGYTLSNTVGGTCPAGSFNGTLYHWCD